jgi:hypothetical protein
VRVRVDSGWIDIPEEKRGQLIEEVIAFHAENVAWHDFISKRGNRYLMRQKQTGPILNGLRAPNGPVDLKKPLRLIRSGLQKSPSRKTYIRTLLYQVGPLQRRRNTSQPS